MDEYQHTRIDQYLRGELSPEEVIAFEEEIKINAELAQEVALQQEIAEAMQEPEIKDLEQKLTELMQGGNNFRRFRLSWQYWAIAASVIVLLGLGYLLRGSFQKKLTPEKLYLTYTELPENLKANSAIRSISGNDTITEGAQPDFWQKIDSLYQAKNYNEAKRQLQEWASTHPQLTDTQKKVFFYYLGIVQLQLGEYEVAFLSLEKVKDPPFAEDAHWYRTLVQLRISGNTESIRKELRVFARYENPYQKLARDLIDELEKGQ